MSDYLSVALNLHGRSCLVVGGGEVAERKLEALLEAGAREVSLVAPEVTAGIAARDGRQGVHVQRRAFGADDLAQVFLAMVATNDAGLNHYIAEAARARGVLVNVADDPTYCDFIMPAVVRRGELGVAVTTGGASPAFARFMRELIEGLVPPEYGELLDITSKLRAELLGQGTRVGPERWQVALHGDAMSLLHAGDPAGARRALQQALMGGPVHAAGREARGRLVLVGAGPGDPGLITVAGRQAIQGADVVLYDRLANSELLGGARASARLVYVGKGLDNSGPMTQDDINTLIVREAQQGNVVVRLKGGDPFVFGRGGEEALAAVAAGVPFTVIPGVSAAVAVPAYAGIPVTHRGLASTFTVITGRQGPAAEPLDWQALVRVGGTLVLLMGVDTLPEIVAELVHVGMDTSTPAAVIEHGTLPDQRVVAGTLGEIDGLVREANITSPATTVVGAVAALAHELRWTAKRTDPGAAMQETPRE